MPLTFLSVASAGPSDILNSSLFTIPKPVGAQQDDFLVAVLACADGTGVLGGFVNPGGWTTMGAGAQTGIGEQIWEKRLGASEPASYDFQNISGSTYHDVS